MRQSKKSQPTPQHPTLAAVEEAFGEDNDMIQSKKSPLTHHRCRLDAEAWAAKQELEAALASDRVDDPPIRGTQAVVKWALLHSLGARGGDEERDTLRQQVADQKLSIDRLEKDLKISRRLCTSLEQDREERDALQRTLDSITNKEELLAVREHYNALVAAVRAASEVCGGEGRFAGEDYAAIVHVLGTELQAAEDRWRRDGAKLTEAKEEVAEIDTLLKADPGAPVRPDETLDAVRRVDLLIQQRHARDLEIKRVQRERDELHEKNAELVAELKQVAEDSAALRDQVKERTRERDQATAQIAAGTEALQDCKAAMESSRETWASNERQLRKRNDTLRKELAEAKAGDPRWLLAGFVGIAVGAAAMLLLRLWGV